MAQDNLQSQSDQELQFKKRARRRLVGAIALVLLMIVVLPMVLEDRTAQTPKADVVISIPSQDKESLESSDSVKNPVNSLPVQAAPIQKVESTPAAEVGANAGGFDPQNETKPSEVKSSEVKPVEIKPSKEEKPIAKPVANVEPTESVQAKSEAPKKAQSDTKPKEVKMDDKAAAGTSSYYIQIGVFSDPDNVKQMQAKLSDKSLKSSSELIDTAKGKKTRLRVGPFKSKKDAEGALVKVQSLSLTGVIGVN